MTLAQNPRPAFGTSAGQRWSECGYPKASVGGKPPQPCGRPTIDGIACAKHATPTGDTHDR